MPRVKRQPTTPTAPDQPDPITEDLSRHPTMPLIECVQQELAMTTNINDLLGTEGIPSAAHDSLSTTNSLSGTTTHQASCLDVATLFKATQAIASELELDTLLARVMDIMLEHSGADHGCLVLAHEDLLLLEAVRTLNPSVTDVLQGQTLDDQVPLSAALVHYVASSRRPLLLQDARRDNPVPPDSYIQQTPVASILCSPLLYQGELLGVLYLENRLALNAFPPERLAVVEALAAQAAISLANVQTVAVKLHAFRLEGVLKFMRFFQHELRGYSAGLESLVPLVRDMFLQAGDVIPSVDGIDPVEVLQGLEVTAEQLTGLTHQLLILTRSGTLASQQCQAVQLENLCRPILLEAAARIAQHELPIILHDALPADLTVLGDPLYLALALRTAVRNALEALGSRVQPGAIRLDAWPVEDKVVVRLHDTGTGFPDALMKRLRGKAGPERVLGFTTKEGGSGLGLALIMQVARLHGGTVMFTNAPDGGAVIEMTVTRAVG